MADTHAEFSTYNYKTSMTCSTPQCLFPHPPHLLMLCSATLTFIWPTSRPLLLLLSPCLSFLICEVGMISTPTSHHVEGFPQKRQRIGRKEAFLLPHRCMAVQCPGLVSRATSSNTPLPPTLPRHIPTQVILLMVLTVPNIVILVCNRHLHWGSFYPPGDLGNI